MFFGSTNASPAQWQLWKVSDEAGNTAYIGDATTGTTAISSGYDGSGRALLAYDAASGGGRRYTYTYSSIDSVSRLTQVKAETKTGGSWTSSPTGVVTVAQVDYAYYQTGDNSEGDNGNLKLVTVSTPMSDTSVTLTRKTHYRYWKGAYNASTNPGYPNTIKLVVGPEGYRRYDWAQNSTLDDDTLSGSTTNLKPYAHAYLEYDTSYRVNSAFFNGECGCGGGSGSGVHSISYATSSTYTSNIGDNQYNNDWSLRAVVKQPAYDPGASPAKYAYITQYFDEVGQPLSRIITDGDPADGTPPPRWVTEVTRDAWDSTDKIGGGIVQIRTPETNDTYTHSSGSIAALSGAGLITAFSRNTTTGADLKGFTTERRYKKGTGGTSYMEAGATYTTTTKTVGSVTVVRPMETETDNYKVDLVTTAKGTSTDYDTLGKSTALHTLVTKDVIDTAPTVATGNNGSGVPTTTARYHNTDGTLAFQKSADGIITYRAYTNGQMTTLIQDADSTILDDTIIIPSSPTNYTSYGTPMHLTTTHVYDAQGRASTTTLPNGHVTKSYYTRLKDGRMVTLSVPKFVSGSPDTVYGPVSYTVTNLTGQAEFTATISLSTSTTALSSWVSTTSGSDPIASLSVGTITRLQTAVHSNDGRKLLESRAYSVVPGSGTGSEGTNYDTTFHGYSPLGEEWRVEEPCGTIRRTVYDALGRVIASWIGTNDNDSTNFPDGDTSGTANMVKTEVITYDGGSANKNSLPTSLTKDADGNWGTTGDQRTTAFAHDFRGRSLLQSNAQSPHFLKKYDNRGRLCAVGVYSSTGSITVGTTDPTGTAANDKANRVGLSEIHYDEQGRVWKTIRHKIALSDGTDADSVSNQKWFDPASRLMKIKGESGHAKYRYDRLGRRTHSFTLATDDDTQYGHATASTAVYDSDDFRTVLAGDIVLEEEQTAFENASGNVLLRATIRRFHDDLANGNAGELDTNADNDRFLYTAANVKGRIQITAMWYDTLDRLADTVNYGTNGGSNFDRDPLSVPSRSDNELRTTNTYHDDGSLLEVENPKGLKTRYTYDASGRKTKIIYNYVDGTPGGGTHGDQDQTILYAYTDGLQTSITADLPSGTDQVTTYIYGSTAGTPSAMKLTTGHLLRAIKYADSSNGGASLASIDSDSSDVISYAYNALSEGVYVKDQVAGIIERDLDTAGRETHRRVTTLGSGLNGAVRRISTAYTSRGQADTVTQYDNATVGSGSVVDQVQNAYDDWGNIITFTQDPDSAIGGGGRASFAVSYTYTKASPTGGAARIRKTTMTSPGGSDLTYEYISASNCLDDAASRVTDIKVGSTVVTTYKYNGVGQVVGTDLNEPNFYWRQYSTSGNYPDLDRFDRVIKSKWTKGNGTPREFYDLDIAYDRGSQITRTVDNIHTASAGGGGNGYFDVSYSLDGLNRLIRAEEGNWTGSAINNTRRDERWMDTSNNSSLSQTGNWGRHRLDTNGDGTFEIDDTRTHNVVNELTGRDTDTSGTDNYNPTYDLDGNMNDDGKDYTYVYDAFGRLKEVKTRGGSPALVTEYTYNGLNNRISWHYDVDISGTTDGSDPTYWFCLDERWRIVATFRASDSSPKERFVFHGAGLAGSGNRSYIDDMILRNKDYNAGWDQASDGTLEERLFYMQNWRHDVSLVVTSASRIVEFDKYYSYGKPFGMPAGDLDSMGSNTGNDFQILMNWIAGGSWDARGDINTDGTVNWTDSSLIPSEYMGFGVLSRSDVQSRTGYAGYHHAPDLAGAKYHVRNRVLDSDLGRWTRRDPLGFVDGYNIYQYATSMPLSTSDPMGLACRVTIDCTLQDDPELGDCSRMCLYECTERPHTRHTIIGVGGCDPTFSCDDMENVKPITVPHIQRLTSRLCQCSFGQLAGRPACPDSTSRTISIEGYDCFENCDRATCLENCQEIYDVVSEGCDELEGPAAVACQTAAEVALEACRTYCEVFCKKLIPTESAAKGQNGRFMNGTKGCTGGQCGGGTGPGAAYLPCGPETSFDR